MKHEYQIVTGGIQDVEVAVTEMISDGWEPVGGIAANGVPYPTFFQAMRRSALTDEDVAAFRKSFGIEPKA